MAGKQSKHRIKTCLVTNGSFIPTKLDKRNIEPATKNKQNFAKIEFKRDEGKDKSAADKSEETSPVTELNKINTDEAKLGRERQELVKHFNNIISTSQETHPSSTVENSMSYCISDLYSNPECSDRYDVIYDHDLGFCGRKTSTFCRKKRGQYDRNPKKQKLKEFDCVSRRYAGNLGQKKASRNKFYNKRKKEQVLKRNAERKEKFGILKVLQAEEIFDAENEDLYLFNNNNDDNEVNDSSLFPYEEGFALCGENAPDDLPEDVVDFLLGLQDREITPEDYDLLLRLDASVPTKTVSEERIASLKHEEVLEQHVADSCGVCMEDYQIGETRKILPCKHVFHANCIDTWLRHNSTKCPLDNTEI
ncbi:uncharacterized protein LOC114519084 [Dendronephthya gigantea]|uniref:uncharacterized protein LOC114519084 n=1 Tax=Dendronephthya gigantea TaxID=151771 RepID=UPI00106B1A2F|nr:uncharacterized protein LOC114519084 [Dendronephthya gigantea]